MVIFLLKEKGLSTGMKAAIFFLSIATAFLLGAMWGRPEIVDATSNILLV